VIKMLVAFSRGRTNIGLLFISAGLAVVFMVKLRAPPRDAVTARGRQVFDAAEAMLSGAHKRLKDAGTALGSQELAWVAAAFGFSVFNSTAANFAFWPALAFTARPNYGRLTVTGPWGSSGSSCGSAGGSSCGGGGSSCGGGGSSCGGGGCGGGGCGGCGGG
jgi:hypothetical protein